MLIHRRNLFESVRPELVLIGWERRRSIDPSSEVISYSTPASEVISFRTIKNVGRGIAFHIHVTALYKALFDPNYPSSFGLSTVRLPVLGPNETTDLDGRIEVSWGDVKQPSDAETKAVGVTISIFCFDTRGARHETEYTLVCIEKPPEGDETEVIAPGVVLTGRKTTARSAHSIRIESKLRSIHRSRFLHKLISSLKTDARRLYTLARKPKKS
jgi:hypothetical protein